MDTAGASARASAGKPLSRDLVLRVCASAGDFSDDWLAGGRSGPKRTVPFPVPPLPGSAFAAAVTGAAAEMGADRLLACRTRAAFMYDPVAELPAHPRALLELLGRWRGPDDFLVSLPDESAAVLVSAAGYAIGAGPPPFLTALTGPDVTGARERFTAWAHQRPNPRLWLVAARHGADGGASDRPPRPDFAERPKRPTLSTTSRPGLMASLCFLRAAAGWEALAVIVLTMLSAPRASHVLPVIGLACWLVFQVFALARTHTVSWAACLRMTAAGAVCAVLLAAAERLGASHPAATVAPWPRVTGPGVTGRAWAAPAEELAKLVPLAVFCLLGRGRARCFAAVDFLLLGVAAGVGFGVAEGTAAALTTPGTGWHLAALLPGWSDAGGVRFPGHAVTSGIAGAGIGLVVAARGRRGRRPAQGRRGRRWICWSRAVWLLPPLLYGWAVLDHLAYDAVVSGGRIPGWAAGLHAATGNGHGSRWLLIALLVACVACDYRTRWRAADAVPPLPGVPLWAGLARTARGAVIAARLREAQRSAAPPQTALSRLRRAWAGLRLGVAEAVVEAGHELALVVVAARFQWNPPRPGPLPAALAFVRERRQLAIGAGRAGGRRPTDMALRRALWPARQRLVRKLTHGGFAVLVVSALVWPGMPGQQGGRVSKQGSAAPRPVPVPRRLPAGRAIDLADRLGAVHHWFSQFIPAGQWLIAAAGIGLLTLLVSGWGRAPVSGRAPQDGAVPARQPWRALRSLTRGLAPGGLPLAAFQLAGALLPPATGQLLAGDPVASPYRWQAHA